MNKMKKPIKGFTLIEMIIVMAILGILMSALMNFYRPIRQTFVDSTMIEDMRTTESGILQYLTESVKYAENLTFYDDGARVTINGGTPIVVDSAAKAYEAFIKGNSITDDASKKRVQVLVIDRKNGYTDTGTSAGDRSSGYGGRLITNILRPEAAKPTAEEFKADDTFMVLGGAYYGSSDFAIFVDKSKTWPEGTYNGEEGGVTFVVQTAMTDESGVIATGAKYGSDNVSVNTKGGLVYLTSTAVANTMNCPSPKYYIAGDNKELSSDATFCKNSNNTVAGSLSPTDYTQINKADKNTYIVILEPDEKR